MKDLYNGEVIATWSDKYSDGEKFVETIFYANGLSINLPMDTFKKVVEELNITLKMIELQEKNTIKKAS
jgi:hypothetical protein